MTTLRIEAALRTFASMPDDDWQPHHWDEFMAARAVAIDEVGRMDRRTEAKAAAQATRNRPRPKPKRHTPDPPELTAAKKVVRERSGGICEHPDGCADRATRAHHKAGRIGRGVHHPDRLLDLCDACHLKTHANPEASYANGSMESRLGGLAVVVDTKGPRP